MSIPLKNARGLLPEALAWLEDHALSPISVDAEPNRDGSAFELLFWAGKRAIDPEKTPLRYQIFTAEEYENGTYRELFGPRSMEAVRLYCEWLAAHPEEI